MSEFRGSASGAQPASSCIRLLGGQAQLTPEEGGHGEEGVPRAARW